MKRILALLTALTAAPLAAAEPAPMITPGPVTFAVIGAYLAFLVVRITGRATCTVPGTWEELTQWCLCLFFYNLLIM